MRLRRLSPTSNGAQSAARCRGQELSTQATEADPILASSPEGDRGRCKCIESIVEPNRIIDLKRAACDFFPMLSLAQSVHQDKLGFVVFDSFAYRLHSLAQKPLAIHRHT